jgi:hypothetical protein
VGVSANIVDASFEALLDAGAGGRVDLRRGRAISAGQVTAAFHGADGLQRGADFGRRDAAESTLARDSALEESDPARSSGGWRRRRHAQRFRRIRSRPALRVRRGPVGRGR